MFLGRDLRLSLGIVLKVNLLLNSSNGAIIEFLIFEHCGWEISGLRELIDLA